MRVTINHEEVTTGFIRKTKYHEVQVDVQFSEEEKHIIEANELRNVVLLERPQGVNHAALPGHEDAYWLRVRNLLNDHPEKYGVKTIGEAKLYEQQLREALQDLKDLITANAKLEDKSASFEL